MSRLYHDDGRPYSDDEYSAHEQQEIARRKLKGLFLKDFCVILLLAMLYRIGDLLYWDGLKVLEYPVFFLFISLLTSIFPAVVASAIFIYAIRIKESRSLFLLLSVLTPFIMVFLEVLTSGHVVSYHHTISFIENGSMTWAGFYKSLFGNIYYLMPLAALSFFIYNPFRNTRN